MGYFTSCCSFPLSVGSICITFLSVLGYIISLVLYNDLGKLIIAIFIIGLIFALIGLVGSYKYKRNWVMAYLIWSLFTFLYIFIVNVIALSNWWHSHKTIYTVLFVCGVLVSLYFFWVILSFIDELKSTEQPPEDAPDSAYLRCIAFDTSYLNSSCGCSLRASSIWVTTLSVLGCILSLLYFDDVGYFIVTISIFGLIFALIGLFGSIKSKRMCVIWYFSWTIFSSLSNFIVAVIALTDKAALRRYCINEWKLSDRQTYEEIYITNCIPRITDIYTVLLACGSMFWLYLLWVILSFIHELNHTQQPQATLIHTSEEVPYSKI